MRKVPNKIKIANARVVDPYTGFDGTGDLYIADGKLLSTPAQTNKSFAKSFNADLVIDASAHVVTPSLVDLNTHLREPGFERKATLRSELSAAVSAGIGHVACLPTCKPTIDSPSVATSIIDKAFDLGLAKVYPIGALTKDLKGEHLSEMKALFDAGCPALTNYYQGIKNLNVLRHCYEYAATFDIPVFIYPQMPDLAEGSCAHEGYWAAKLGLPGIPETAETIAIATHLLLIEQTGVRAHFSQLSCAKSLTLIEQAINKQRLNITADVAAHQLFLDDSCLESYNSLYKLCPPLRSQKDIQGLLKGLEKGVIGSICSSHQPHEEDAKLLPFESAEYGISALETLLPLSTRLVSNKLSLLDILGKLTKNPAELLNIKRKGIVLGEKADLCIFNNKIDWEFNHTQMLSAGKNSPFTGTHFNARNDYTFVEGALVYSRNPY